jgi:hypothetical protein
MRTQDNFSQGKKTKKWLVAGGGIKEAHPL